MTVDAQVEDRTIEAEQPAIPPLPRLGQQRARPCSCCTSSAGMRAPGTPGRRVRCGRTTGSGARPARTWRDRVGGRVRAARGMEDIAAFARALGLGRLRIVGFSMGGHAALRYAAEHPEPSSAWSSGRRSPAAAPARVYLEAWLDQRPVRRSGRRRYGAPRALIPRAHEARLRHWVLHNLLGRDDGRWTWRYDAPAAEAGRSPCEDGPRTDARGAPEDRLSHAGGARRRERDVRARPSRGGSHHPERSGRCISDARALGAPGQPNRLSRGRAGVPLRGFDVSTEMTGSILSPGDGAITAASSARSRSRSAPPTAAGVQHLGSTWSGGEVVARTTT